MTNKSNLWCENCGKFVGRKFERSVVDIEYEWDGNDWFFVGHGDIHQVSTKSCAHCGSYVGV